MPKDAKNQRRTKPAVRVQHNILGHHFFVEEYPTRVLSVEEVETMRQSGEWNRPELMFIADQAAFDLIDRFGIVDASLREPLKEWLAVCIKEFFDELQVKQLTNQRTLLAKKNIYRDGHQVLYWLKLLYSKELREYLHPFVKLENGCVRDIKHLTAILTRADRHVRKRQQGNAAKPALLSLAASIYDFCVPDTATQHRAMKIGQSSKLIQFANYIYAIVGHRCDDRMVRERFRRAARYDVRAERSHAVRAMFLRIQGKRFSLDEGPPPGWNNAMSRK